MNFILHLDEAGDLGFDFKNKKPSTHFCITLLLCKNRKTFLNIRSTVKKTIARKLFSKKMKRPVQELKGTDTRLAVKKYFYNQILQTETDEQQFEIYSVIVDKRKMLPFIKKIHDIHHLYNIIAKNVLDLIDFSNPEIKEVLLFVDSCKGNKERKIFDDYIRLHIEAKLPINSSLNITHDISHETPNLQAVDLFCYGIIRKYSVNDMDWYNCFADKIVKEVLLEPKI